MNTQTTIGRWLAIVAMPCIISFASPSQAAIAAAPVRLNPRITLSAVEAARLQAAADQGMTSLRRYVWRTRTVYNYLLSDLI